MKYYPRLDLYKAPNLVLDPKTLKSYSYEWYLLSASFGGVVVVNRYNYSATTIKHRYKVLNQLEELGVREWIDIEAPKGLQNLDAAIEHYQYLIKKLENEIAKPRSQKAKNIERKKEIKAHMNKISLCKTLKKAKIA